MSISVENSYGDSYNVGIGFTTNIDVAINFADVLVDDVLLAVFKYDGGGVNSPGFPTDDAGNAWTGGDLADIVPDSITGGQNTKWYYVKVTNQLSIGQSVHFLYSGAGAEPGNSWDMYHLRGVGDFAGQFHQTNHVDLGGDVWHDVGACSPPISMVVPGPGVVFSHNWIITPYVAYGVGPAGPGEVTASFTWNDPLSMSTDSAWTSDPDNLAQYGFDTTRGVTGQAFPAAAGMLDIAGCWDQSVDSYRGYSAVYFPEATTPPPPPPPPVASNPADVPSLDVCGLEISNPARAWSYLRNGLGSDRWRFGAACIPQVYFEDPASTDVLAFTDVAGSGGGSPAPWYDPAQPDSEEFLGLLLTSLDGFDSTVSRTVTQRAGGIQGGSIGSQHLDARVIQGHGFLVGASCCGLEYGRRWLINTLSAAPCDPCGLCDITVRTCPPPSDGSDDDRGRWSLYDVALVDGPHEVAKSLDAEGGDCCDYLEVDFTLTAGNPYLYKQRIPCVSGAQLQPSAGSDCMPFEDWFCGPPGDLICCTVDPPLVGTLGAIVTIDATLEAVGGIEIATYLNCPPSGSDTPESAITIPLLVLGSVLTIDSARRVITYTAPDGTILDGTQFIQFPEGRAMDWIEVSDCSPATCICVNALHPCSGGNQAYVSIWTQERLR